MWRSRKCRCVLSAISAAAPGGGVRALPRSLAIVTAFYPPAIGGVERYSQEFARAASAMGVAVNVITTATIPQPEIAIEDNGVNVLRIPARHIPLSGSYFPLPTSGKRRAAQFLRCDVVMAHTRFFPTTLMAAGIAATQGKRICVVEHGSGPLRSNPAFAVASLGYEHLITLGLRSFSPSFFAVSVAASQWLHHFGIRGAPVVPNGVAPRSTMPLRSAASFEKPIVFFAGRLFAEKGVSELVNAVELLVRSGMKLELRVAGVGPLSNMLEKRAAQLPYLTYLGRLTPDEVASELERATVFVNPSNCAEGLPTILLEAGSAALPVISTLIGGSTELVQNGSTGWTIRRGEATLIACTLKEALSKPAEALHRGARLFGAVQDRHTWPAIVEGFFLHLSHRKGHARRTIGSEAAVPAAEIEADFGMEYLK